MRCAFFEATVARTHTLLCHALWVARSSVGSPVAFLVATPWWPPDRCAAGLDISCGAQRLGKAATLVSQGGLLPAGTCWTRLLSSMWGD